MRTCDDPAGGSLSGFWPVLSGEAGLEVAGRGSEKKELMVVADDGFMGFKKMKRFFLGIVI